MIRGSTREEVPESTRETRGDLTEETFQRAQDTVAFARQRSKGRASRQRGGTSAKS